MGRRKAGKSVDFLKIRDAEGRIVTQVRFLKSSLCASTRGFAFEPKAVWELAHKRLGEKFSCRRVPLSIFVDKKMYL